MLRKKLSFFKQRMKCKKLDFLNTNKISPVMFLNIFINRINRVFTVKRAINVKNFLIFKLLIIKKIYVSLGKGKKPRECTKTN